MTRTFECMFLVDNDAVRAGWREAKAGVTALIEKHDGKVLSSRRWDERRLAYPIRHKNRATFLLNFCEFPNESVEGLRRELDLAESVMRYMILGADGVPDEEIELTKAEEGDDFQVPEPPEDDALDFVPEPEKPAGEELSEGEAAPSGDDVAAAPKSESAAPAAEAPEAPAAAASEATAEAVTTEEKEG